MRSVGRAALVAMAIVAGFVATAPWHIAAREVGRVSVALVIAGIIFVAMAWRQLLVLLSIEYRASTVTIVFASACVALFLLRVTTAQFLSLNVNAWDFSIYFDRPLERTVHGQLLFSDYLGTSTLAAHADFITLLFAPLYAVHPSPWWLVAGQALVLAAGVIGGFAAFRHILVDDAAALLLAAAFLFNRYTAKTAQYVFHHEVFYPAALFLAVWAFLTRRRFLLVLAALFVLLIKQDAFLPLIGMAITFAVFFGRRWDAAWVTGLAITGFALDYFLVMPHFASAAQPWYSWYWGTWGVTPLDAAVQIALHPLRVGVALWHSGAPRLLATLLLAPLFGFEWFIAATPAMVVAGVAQFAKLRQFDLYYSMPFLPLLFCGTAAGVARLTKRRLTRMRICCVAIFLTCAFTGSGYVIPRSRREATRTQAILAALRDELPVRIESSLYPHAGYERSRMILDRADVSAATAYLFVADADPYPLSPGQLKQLRKALLRSEQFTIERDGDLEFFIPRSNQRGESYRQ
jgi:hypothetical protein